MHLLAGCLTFLLSLPLLALALRLLSRALHPPEDALSCPGFPPHAPLEGDLSSPGFPPHAPPGGAGAGQARHVYVPGGAFALPSSPALRPGAASAAAAAAVTAAAAAAAAGGAQGSGGSSSNTGGFSGTGNGKGGGGGGSGGSDGYAKPLLPPAPAGALQLLSCLNPNPAPGVVLLRAATWGLSCAAGYAMYCHGMWGVGSTMMEYVGLEAHIRGARSLLLLPATLLLLLDLAGGCEGRGGSFRSVRFRVGRFSDVACRGARSWEGQGGAHQGGSLAAAAADHPLAT